MGTPSSKNDDHKIGNMISVQLFRLSQVNLHTEAICDFSFIIWKYFGTPVTVTDRMAERSEGLCFQAQTMLTSSFFPFL